MKGGTSFVATGPGTNPVQSGKVGDLRGAKGDKLR